jgi:hypothetical protein
MEDKGMHHETTKKYTRDEKEDHPSFHWGGNSSIHSIGVHTCTDNGDGFIIHNVDYWWSIYGFNDVGNVVY